MVEITEGENSWISIEDADTYFESRFGAEDTWAGLSLAQKTSALITAFKQIMSCRLFSVAADSDLAAVKEGQCEQAIYIVNNGQDTEARLALRSQGVTQSDVVGETYDVAGELSMIGPYAQGLLEGFRVNGASGFFAGDLTNDENEQVSNG
jgi:hypothetical protein